MLRHNQCSISSAIQGHHVLSSEHLAQSTEHTAVWLASEEKSRGWSVLWREPKSSIRFQMCAIWLITSVKRIKLWFYIILFTWLSISQKDKFISLRAELIISTHRTVPMNNGLKGSQWKITNILTLIIAGVLQKPYISHFWQFIFFLLQLIAGIIFPVQKRFHNVVAEWNNH